jgi:hypothetical protein
MVLTNQQVLRVAAMAVIACFAVFMVICWTRVEQSGPQQPMTIGLFLSGWLVQSPPPWQPAEAALSFGAWLLALLGSFALWRPSRRVAIAGFLVSFLWLIWAVLPMS